MTRRAASPRIPGHNTVTRETAEMADGAPTTILSVTELCKSYGQREILKDLAFSIFKGARIGLIGRNGEGKSTFVRMLAGMEQPTTGQIHIKPDVTVAAVLQEPDLDPTKTVAECLEEGVASVRKLLTDYDDLSMKLGEDLDADAMQEVLDKMEKVQAQIDLTEAWELDHKLEVAAEAMHLPPQDALVETLSGGERRRVDLCRVLMAHPDFLILDEPTNHLDAELVAWLEGYLAEYTGTYMVVTHDRYFLDNVTNWIVEVDRGRLRIYEGNYSAYLEKRSGSEESGERAQRKRGRVLERELEWIRSNPKARQTKSRARLKNYELLLEQFEAFEADKASAQIRFPTGMHLGNDVIRVQGLKKAYGDKILFDDLSFEVPRGAIVGITGANGLGKTTLIRMILGEEEPDGGFLKVGKTVSFCYAEQNRSQLDPDKTVYQEISEGNDFLTIGKQRMHMRAYLTQFLFSGSIQQTKVGKLSGGERNRMQLAKMLRHGGNVLILDEPTNDLDLNTLRVLEESLLSFPGCALIITHDRYFLDRIATHVLAFEGDAKQTWCEGSYQIYTAQKARREAEEGKAKPKGKKRKMRK